MRTSKRLWNRGHRIVRPPGCPHGEGWRSPAAMPDRHRFRDAIPWLRSALPGAKIREDRIHALQVTIRVRHLAAFE